MAHFDLSNYETVASRITRFWQDYPNGRIATEIVHISESGKQFVIKAMVYRDISDPQPIATGLAEEHFADRGPNETSPCENGETSAIGRALVNWYMSSTSDARPSREEMTKVNNYSSPSPSPEKAREVAQQVRSSSPSSKVDDDPRWKRILEAAAVALNDEKLQSIVSNGKQRGTLTEKQFAFGSRLAENVLKKNPVPGVVKKVEDVFGTTEVGIWADGEEPF